MDTRNYNAALASAPARYHKAKRGGNKVLNEYLERNNYDNNSLLACCYVSRGNNNKLNNTIMATKNLLTSGLGVNVLRGVRLGMFDSFCVSLCNSLASSCSCGLGSDVYQSLINAWCQDTANCCYVLNESEGRKLYTANPSDPRVRRIGVDGHWSFFVAPPANNQDDDNNDSRVRRIDREGHWSFFVAPPANNNNKESDSISVLVGSWLRSWSSWYDSVVCYGHYGVGGVPAASSVTADLLSRCSALWSSRGVGGRTAATSEEKKQKKVAKAVEGLSAVELLAALKASGVDLSALMSGSAPSADNNKKE